MIKVYTLPTCPICDMIKKKLKAKNVDYIECPFEELLNTVDTDRAPAIQIINDNNPDNYVYLLSPMEMNKWIEAM